MRSNSLKAVGAFLILLGVQSAAACFGLQAQESVTPSKSYQTVSLFGEKHSSGPASPEAESRLETARQGHEANPTEASFVGLGRTLVSTGRIREAIGVFTDGLAAYPASYTLYRRRGHRFITLRQFTRALADFEKAADLIEGLPVANADGSGTVPSGSVGSDMAFDIYYHFGLAAYLSRDFGLAEEQYWRCHSVVAGDAGVVSIANWLYMTLRRKGEQAEAKGLLAPLHSGMEAGAEVVYLERAFMFRGEVSEEEYAASEGIAPIRDYGLAFVNLLRGDQIEAKAFLEKALEAGVWMGFADMAAEVELAHMLSDNPDRTSVESVMDHWVLAWNLYDLDLVEDLFEHSPNSTYFSSERPGAINGFDELMDHHRGFGFVPGGKTADARLWLEDQVVNDDGNMAYVAAQWFFDRDVVDSGPVQQGPVTFVLIRGQDGWRIIHGHFANDPPPVEG